MSEHKSYDWCYEWVDKSDVAAPMFGRMSENGFRLCCIREMQDGTVFYFQRPAPSVERAPE